MSFDYVGPQAPEGGCPPVKEKHNPPNNVKSARLYRKQEQRERSQRFELEPLTRAKNSPTDVWFDLLEGINAAAAENASQGQECPCMPWFECTCGRAKHD